MHKAASFGLVLMLLPGCSPSDEPQGNEADAQVTPYEDAQATTYDVAPADASETSTAEEEAVQAVPDADACADAQPECKPHCGDHVAEEATCTDGHWECPPVDECPPNPVECPAEGEMSAMSGAVCTGMAGLDCVYLDGAYDECPGGDFYCSCGDNGFWNCDCSM